MKLTHDSNCEWNIGHDCTCGLDKIQAAATRFTPNPLRDTVLAKPATQGSAPTGDPQPGQAKASDGFCEIWRKTPGDYYSPSLSVSPDGESIRIDKGGMVVTLSLSLLHFLACTHRPDLHGESPKVESQGAPSPAPAGDLSEDQALKALEELEIAVDACAHAQYEDGRCYSLEPYRIEEIRSAKQVILDMIFRPAPASPPPVQAPAAGPLELAAKAVSRAWHSYRQSVADGYPPAALKAFPEMFQEDIARLDKALAGAPSAGRPMEARLETYGEEGNYSYVLAVGDAEGMVFEVEVDPAKGERVAQAINAFEGAGRLMTWTRADEISDARNTYIEGFMDGWGDNINQDVLILAMKAWDASDSRAQVETSASESVERSDTAPSLSGSVEAYPGGSIQGASGAQTVHVIGTRVNPDTPSHLTGEAKADPGQEEG